MKKKRLQKFEFFNKDKKKSVNEAKLSDNTYRGYPIPFLGFLHELNVADRGHMMPIDSPMEEILEEYDEQQMYTRDEPEYMMGGKITQEEFDALVASIKSESEFMIRVCSEENELDIDCSKFRSCYTTSYWSFRWSDDVCTIMIFE